MYCSGVLAVNIQINNLAEDLLEIRALKQSLGQSVTIRVHCYHDGFDYSTEMKADTHIQDLERTILDKYGEFMSTL